MTVGAKRGITLARVLSPARSPALLPLAKPGPRRQHVTAAFVSAVLAVLVAVSGLRSCAPGGTASRDVAGRDEPSRARQEVTH